MSRAMQLHRLSLTVHSETTECLFLSGRHLGLPAALVIGYMFYVVVDLSVEATVSFRASRPLVVETVQVAMAAGKMNVAITNNDLLSEF